MLPLLPIPILPEHIWQDVAEDEVRSYRNEPTDGEPVVGSNAAPSLTHLMSRTCFRGCTMPITTENLERWLRDPQAVEATEPVRRADLVDQQLGEHVAFTAHPALA